MRELPVELYRAAQVRELDRIAIEERGIPGYTLMSRAGEAAFKLLRQCWPGAHRPWGRPWPSDCRPGVLHEAGAARQRGRAGRDRVRLDRAARDVLGGPAAVHQ